MLSLMRIKQMISKGQSVAEYALVGGLVLLVSIPALGTLNSVFNSKLGQSTTSMGTLQQSLASFSPAATGTSAGSGSGQGGTTGSGTGSTVAGAQTLTVDLGNGKTITVPNYPTNATQLIETAGTSGYTDQLMASISTFAQQLKDAGEITDTQFNALMALSNQGHKMGTIQKFLEDYVSANPTTDPATQTVLYNGQSYLLEALIQTTGNNFGSWDGATKTYVFQPSTDLNAIMSVPRDGSSYENDAFIDLYKAALSSGALNNASIKALVDNATYAVSAVGDSLEHNLLNRQFDQLDKNVASTFTHQNSQAICETGNGSDTGVSCNG
jgi:hypothetical protein